MAMVAIFTETAAQTRYEVRKYEEAESSFEDAMPEAYDIENAAAYAMYAHPSLVGLLSDSTRGHKALVMAGYSNEISHGDYLHYRGNHTTDASVLAGGEVEVKGVGTLYGHAYYGRERQRSLYQNYAIRPEDYMPYFVSDSVSVGDIDNEHYLVEGGLSMSCRNWRYGIGGFYEGIAGAKDTQPKRSVYSYWFRLVLGAAKITPGWIMAVKAWPEINKQSISASSSANSYRFMQFYGFGQWNRKESTTGYGYGRDSKILGAGGEVLFCSNPAANRAWNVSLGFAYNYRWMQTEETTFKNLYSTKTHHLSHSMAISGRPWSSVGLYVLLSGEENFRSGGENVYERQKQDAEQSLYDYVKVGINQLYNSSGFSETLLVKAVWSAMPRHFFSMSAGVGTDWYREEYDMPEITVENHTVTPQAGIGYKFDGNKDHVDFEVMASLRTGISNKYALVSQKPTQFETAQAYIPYLLRGEDRWQLHSSLVYTRDAGPGAIGARINAGYSRRTGAPYVSGWETPYGQKRSSKSFDISVFYMF